MLNNLHLFTGTPILDEQVRIECNGHYCANVDYLDVAYYLIEQVFDEDTALTHEEDFSDIVCDQFSIHGWSIWAGDIRHTIDQLQKCSGK